MNSQYIRQIVEQLAISTGQPTIKSKNRNHLIEQETNYTIDDIHLFIEDLS